MRCGNCNYEQVEPTTVKLEEWDGNDLLVIEDVPVEKCPQCGEEYFSPQVLEEIEALLLHLHTPHPVQPEMVLQVPVFKFSLAV
jgi:YgiT-type zinc finger domain-containing protein